jgi:hypothetical protein
MKLILQSIIGSVIIHVIYFVAILGIGYVQTSNYTPDLANGEAYTNEVAFGNLVSPVYYGLSFVGVSILVAVWRVTYEKFFTGEA